MGFVECGSQLDEEDGLELYFVRRLASGPTMVPGAGRLTGNCACKSRGDFYMACAEKECAGRLHAATTRTALDVGLHSPLTPVVLLVESSCVFDAAHFREHGGDLLRLDLP